MLTCSERAAITQLFRLSSSTYTLPSGGNGSTSAASSPLSTFLSPSAASSSAAIPFDPSNATQMAEVLSSLLNQVQAQSAQLQSLGTSIANEKQRYHQLGKPIGGTFIMLGLLFLYLGRFLFFPSSSRPIGHISKVCVAESRSCAGSLRVNLTLCIPRLASVPVCPAPPYEQQLLPTGEEERPDRLLLHRRSPHCRVHEHSRRSIMTSILLTLDESFRIFRRYLPYLYGSRPYRGTCVQSLHAPPFSHVSRASMHAFIQSVNQAVSL